MTWVTPGTPNLPDYTLFVSGVMGIDPLYLPPDSPFLGYAFYRALQLVIDIPTRPWSWNWPPVPLNGGIEYTLAVYNCAGHIQLVITPDQVVNGTAYDFFKRQRIDNQLLQTVVGLPASTSDEGTSVTNAVPDAMRQLTIGDLGFMKTYWGRSYLEYAQDFGGVWGLS